MLESWRITEDEVSHHLYVRLDVVVYHLDFTIQLVSDGEISDSHACVLHLFENLEQAALDLYLRRVVNDILSML